MTRGPDFWERHLPAGTGIGALAFVAWSVGCAALAAALGLYVLLTPGFAASLAGGGPAAGYLLRQIVFNGLPVVFALNLVSLALYLRLARGRGRPGAALAIDTALRASLFLGLHAAIYPLAAEGFGSFGGDPRQALGAVGPTLAAAGRFGNLSGVYLYASAACAYPVFAAALRARLGPLPARWVLAAFVPWFALVAAVVSGLGALAGALVEPGPGTG